jgi:hypothetical protein
LNRLSPVADTTRWGNHRVVPPEHVILESGASADGLKRWELVRRDDGFFLYSEDRFVSEDLREFGGRIERYWTPTHCSGLFDTAEATRADAVGQLPWLRDVELRR